MCPWNISFVSELRANYDVVEVAAAAAAVEEAELGEVVCRRFGGRSSTIESIDRQQADRLWNSIFERPAQP